MLCHCRIAVAGGELKGSGGGARRHGPPPTESLQVISKARSKGRSEATVQPKVQTKVTLHNDRPVVSRGLFVVVVCSLLLCHTIGPVLIASVNFFFQYAIITIAKCVTCIRACANFTRTQCAMHEKMLECNYLLRN